MHDEYVRSEICRHQLLTQCPRTGQDKKVWKTPRHIGHRHLGFWEPAEGEEDENITLQTLDQWRLIPDPLTTSILIKSLRQ